MKNKKILIISHQFLPFVSPRTTRWSLLIDELTKRGNEVTVLTGTAPEELKKNYEVLYFGNKKFSSNINKVRSCLLYTSPSPRDKRQSRMPSSA